MVNWQAWFHVISCAKIYSHNHPGSSYHFRRFLWIFLAANSQKDPPWRCEDTCNCDGRLNQMESNENETQRNAETKIFSKAPSIAETRYGIFSNRCLQNTGFDRGIRKSNGISHMESITWRYALIYYTYWLIGTGLILLVTPPDKLTHQSFRHVVRCHRWIIGKTLAVRSLRIVQNSLLLQHDHYQPVRRIVRPLVDPSVRQSNFLRTFST